MDVQDVLDVCVENKSELIVNKCNLLYPVCLVENNLEYWIRASVQPIGPQSHSRYDWWHLSKERERNDGFEFSYPDGNSAKNIGFVQNLRAKIQLHPRLKDPNLLAAMDEMGLDLSLLELEFANPLQPGQCGVFRIELKPKSSEEGVFRKPSVASQLAGKREPHTYKTSLTFHDGGEIRALVRERFERAIRLSSGELQERIERVRAIFRSEMIPDPKDSFVLDTNISSIVFPETDMNVVELSGIGLATIAELPSGMPTDGRALATYTWFHTDSESTSGVRQLAWRLLGDLESRKELSKNEIRTSSGLVGSELDELIQVLLSFGLIEANVDNELFTKRHGASRTDVLLCIHRFWKSHKSTKFGGLRWGSDETVRVQLAWDALSEGFVDPALILASRADRLEASIARIILGGFKNWVATWVSIVLALLAIALSIIFEFWH